MLCVNLVYGHLPVFLSSFQGCQLCFGVYDAFLCCFFSSTLSLLSNVSRLFRSHIDLTPPTETRIPLFLSSLLALNWPYAGCSYAKAITASSTSSATLFLIHASCGFYPLILLFHAPRKHSLYHKMLMVYSMDLACLAYILYIFSKLQQTHFTSDYAILYGHG